MRVHLGNAELVHELVRYFEGQPDCVVRRVGETEVEVSLLGSYRRAWHDVAVQQRLSAFLGEGNGNSHRVGPPRLNGNGNGNGHANGNGAAH